MYNQYARAQYRACPRQSDPFETDKLVARTQGCDRSTSNISISCASSFRISSAPDSAPSWISMRQVPWDEQTSIRFVALRNPVFVFAGGSRGSPHKLGVLLGLNIPEFFYTSNPYDSLVSRSFMVRFESYDHDPSFRPTHPLCSRIRIHDENDVTRQREDPRGFLNRVGVSWLSGGGETGPREDTCHLGCRSIQMPKPRTNAEATEAMVKAVPQGS